MQVQMQTDILVRVQIHVHLMYSYFYKYRYACKLYCEIASAPLPSHTPCHRTCHRPTSNTTGVFLYTHLATDLLLAQPAHTCLLVLTVTHMNVHMCVDRLSTRALFPSSVCITRMKNTRYSSQQWLLYFRPLFRSHGRFFHKVGGSMGILSKRYSQNCCYYVK